MTIEKENIGLAGEYAVASEFCKRGFYAQLTLGHYKKTDLFVEKNGRNIFRVSVKSKQKYEWPKVKGISEMGDLLVLVDFKGKKANERPDFYILKVKDWKKVVKKWMEEKGKGTR